MTLSQSLLQKFLNQQFRYFVSIDSTNIAAQNWLRGGAERGSVVIADEQTSGRGRRGRTWYTPPNVALALSVILKPPTENASQLSIVGALAVYELCEFVGLSNIGIKWPNDVQIKGKKISGILPEAVWEGDKLLGVVLGIGVNVRNRFEGELVEIATSIEAELGQSVDRIELIAYLLERVNFWAAALGSDELLQTWKNRLNTLGQVVIVEGINQRIVGQAVDVERNGTLLIKTGDGSIQRVMAGDVNLRPQDEG
jgi:BirA family transcriptional regulator, biotin operon repressor / biotin---[acetyl-CoA-carboxylase] ligase